MDHTTSSSIESLDEMLFEHITGSSNTYDDNQIIKMIGGEDNSDCSPIETPEPECPSDCSIFPNLAHTSLSHEFSSTTVFNTPERPLIIFGGSDTTEENLNCESEIIENPIDPCLRETYCSEQFPDLGFSSTSSDTSDSDNSDVLLPHFLLSSNLQLGGGDIEFNINTPELEESNQDGGLSTPEITVSIGNVGNFNTVNTSLLPKKTNRNPINNLDVETPQLGIYSSDEQITSSENITNFSEENRPVVTYDFPKGNIWYKATYRRDPTLNAVDFFSPNKTLTQSYINGCKNNSGWIHRYKLVNPITNIKLISTAEIANKWNEDTIVREVCSNGKYRGITYTRDSYDTIPSFHIALCDPNNDLQYLDSQTCNEDQKMGIPVRLL